MFNTKNKDVNANCLSFVYDTDYMPLGDPCGGEFRYTEEGLPKSISAVTISAGNLNESMNFYSSLLGFDILEKKDNKVYLTRDAVVIILVNDGNPPRDTGIYLGVENPYDIHRRLIDEGVIFVNDPMNTPIGVTTSFKDCYGNIIHAVDVLGKV